MCDLQHTLKLFESNNACFFGACACDRTPHMPKPELVQLEFTKNIKTFQMSLY